MTCKMALRASVIAALCEAHDHHNDSWPLSCRLHTQQVDRLHFTQYILSLGMPSDQSSLPNIVTFFLYLVVTGCKQI